MAINRSDILTRLQSQVRVGFLQGSKGWESRRSSFVRETDSAGAFEQYSDLGAMPMPTRSGGQQGSSGEDERTGSEVTGGLHDGGQTTTFGANERGLIIYNDSWELATSIKNTAIADDSVGGLRDWAMQAGQQFERHYDQLCFAALNSGDSTAYGKTYDGLSLFNAAHVDKGARYQIAQDNALTLALSVDNFETAKITAGAFKDGQGNNTGFSYNTLVVSDSLERIGSQIALNTNVYDTANRELNPYAGTKLVVAPGGYLDSTAWYLTAGDMLVKPIILQKRQKPMLKVWEDNHAGVIWFKWTARYNVGYADWRTVVQGNS